MKKELKKRILRKLGGEMNFEDILRNNAINLAKQHKEYCNKEDCGVSLVLLRELLTGKHK